MGFGKRSRQDSIITLGMALNIHVYLMYQIHVSNMGRYMFQICKCAHKKYGICWVCTCRYLPALIYDIKLPCSFCVCCGSAMKVQTGGACKPYDHFQTLENALFSSSLMSKSQESFCCSVSMSGCHLKTPLQGPTTSC